MCLKVNEDFKTRAEARAFYKKPLRAKEDIIVYKVLEVHNRGVEPQYQSQYRGTEYTLGEVKKAIKFSSYIDWWHNSKWELSINKGLHAYTNRSYAFSQAKRESGWSVVECVIPKGTLYFKGSRDIVSLKLKVGLQAKKR